MSNEELSALENRIHYHFRNKDVLLEALTHRSFYHENPNRADAYNERLEFLGDSVLGFAIVEYLFFLDGNFTESVMAKTKSYLVKEAVLSEIALSISLGEYLRLGKGEEHTGGRTKKSLLADAFEALLGAVYVDGGFGPAKQLVMGLFREQIEMIIFSREFHDFKTELQEKTQLLFNSIPEYQIIRQEGEEHKKVFTVEVFIAGEKFGMGIGKSKKEAETIAAQEALSRFQQ